MNDLITSFLLQTGECSLPGIGTLSRNDTPSVLHVANKELLPPVSQFQFTEISNPIQEELIKYVAGKKRIPDTQAETDLGQTFAQWKETLNAGQSITFPSVGTVSGINGYVVFKETAPLFVATPVEAQRVVHKNSRHTLVVGDKETDSEEMNALLQSETENASSGMFWKIAAIILFLIGLGILIYHYTSGKHSHPFGNETKIETKVPAPSYTQ